MITALLILFLTQAPARDTIRDLVCISYRDNTGLHMVTFKTLPEKDRFFTIGHVYCRKHQRNEKTYWWPSGERFVLIGYKTQQFDGWVLNREFKNDD